MEWEHDHIVEVNGQAEFPADPSTDRLKWRRKIEPWLSAVFQAEHLSLLVGNGLTSAIALQAKAKPITLGTVGFGCPNEDKVMAAASQRASSMGRSSANLEDQLSSALSLLGGLKILGHPDVVAWEGAIDRVLGGFVTEVLAMERDVEKGWDLAPSSARLTPREMLVSFLMSFASRAASRERLHVFTTNYDRMIERGADLSGLRIVDRFVGALEPEFRSSRLQVDLHYSRRPWRAAPSRRGGASDQASWVVGMEI
jgi:hypothetical protein